MNRGVENYVYGALALVILAAIVCLSAIVAFYVGLAWSLIIAVVVGVLIGRFAPTGPYGEGAYAVFAIWILIAIGVVIGLVTRWVVP